MKMTKLGNRKLELLALMVMGACVVSQIAMAAVHVVGPAENLRVETIQPGDTIELKDGVYTKVPPLVSGTAQAPVTYRAANP